MVKQAKERPGSNHCGDRRAKEKTARLADCVVLCLFRQVYLTGLTDTNLSGGSVQPMEICLSNTCFAVLILLCRWRRDEGDEQM